MKYGNIKRIGPRSRSFLKTTSYLINSPLSQNYPNPFNPTTSFEFQIADFGFVNLTIYDATGREVETLVNEQLSAGTYEAIWNAAEYSSGIYFYKITAGVFVETNRMILLK